MAHHAPSTIDEMKLNGNKSQRHISAGRLGGTFSAKNMKAKKKLSKIESKPAFSSTHQRNSRVQLLSETHLIDRAAKALFTEAEKSGSHH